MKDRLRKRRINLNAKYIPNLFGKKKKRTLKKCLKSLVNDKTIPLLGEQLFKKQDEKLDCLNRNWFIKEE